MNDSKGGKGSKRIAFDLDDPKLPAEIEDKALGSGRLSPRRLRQG